MIKRVHKINEKAIKELVASWGKILTTKENLSFLGLHFVVPKIIYDEDISKDYRTKKVGYFICTND